MENLGLIENLLQISYILGYQNNQVNKKEIIPTAILKVHRYDVQFDLINDLARVLKHADSIMYADDTVLYLADDNVRMAR